MNHLTTLPLSASDRELNIFGIGLAGGEKLDSIKTPTPTPMFPKTREEHKVTGIVRQVEGYTLETREHKIVRVDSGKACESFRCPAVFVGATLVAEGNYDPSGDLQGTVVWRAKSSPLAWPPDR